MVKIETRRGEERKWIIDPELCHWLWEKINDSPHVRFTEGIAMLYKLVGWEDDNLVRLAGETVDGPDDWSNPFNLANPQMRMSQRLSFKLRSDDPKEVRVAIYAKTNNGANFVHEFYQDRGEPASFIIRAPVPDNLRERANEIADNYPNCEMVREQVGSFQERFNVTDEDAPFSYYEPHIKCEGVHDSDEIKAVFNDVLDIVERGVRSSR
jgi:hypothetical protein